MTTTHATGHLTRWALTLVLLAALGGCYLLHPAPPVRPGATEDFDAVVAKIQQLDGVASTDLAHIDDVTEGDYVTGRIDVRDGYDAVQVLDEALAELYWFGEYAPSPASVWARDADGRAADLNGAIRPNAVQDWLTSEDMEERYGP